MILTMTEKFDEVIPGVNYVGKQRFDNAFFEKHVPNVRQVSRFILCGPPTMVRLVPAGLNEMGITNDKIYLV
jgi:NAD(P)H-flavin reductase